MLVGLANYSTYSVDLAEFLGKMAGPIGLNGGAQPQHVRTRSPLNGGRGADPPSQARAPRTGPSRSRLVGNAQTRETFGPSASL